eukprot:scaffold2838_cov112-Cylindrotheca_fusiformis.AAC.4
MSDVDSMTKEEGKEEAPAAKICDNQFLPALHSIRAPCQVCVFRLSEKDKKKLEQNGRHLNVTKTRGGCENCEAFPSQEGEDPVRLCRQCFFDTHKLSPRKEEPFSGPTGLPGVPNPPWKRRY